MDPTTTVFSGRNLFFNKDGVLDILKRILSYFKIPTPVTKRISIKPRRHTKLIQNNPLIYQTNQNETNSNTKRITLERQANKQKTRQETRRRVDSKSKHLNKTKAQKSLQRAANVRNPNRQESLQSYWIIRKRRAQKVLCSP